MDNWVFLFVWMWNEVVFDHVVPCPLLNLGMQMGFLTFDEYWVGIELAVLQLLLLLLIGGFP